MFSALPQSCRCCASWKVVRLPAVRCDEVALCDESTDALVHRDAVAPACGARRRLAVLAGHAVDGAAAAITSSSGVPRPFRFVAPQPTAASDGGVLINTVLGEISTTQLGWTSSHEHIFTNDAKSAAVAKAYPEIFPRDFILREGVAALKLFRAAGGRTIVDCTTVDLGRNITLMAEVARAAEVNVVATTGCWIDVPLVWSRMDTNALAALYIKDCTVGIEGSGVKAGIIKCAHQTGITWKQGKGFTRTGQNTLRACARAAKATGLPITTHTEVEERIGLAQIELFKEEGVDLNRVYIGHNNDTTDLDYLTAILEQGVWLGLDRTTAYQVEGLMGHQPDWRERARTIKRLIDAGWGHRILVGHDTMIFSGQAGTGPEDPPPHMGRTAEENRTNYCFLINKVLPLVMELGATKEQIDKIVLDNPRRFFENKP